MRSITEEWQKKWREALGESTDSMPDFREDYSLQFDIWNVGEEKLADCFSVFPQGGKILRRVNEVRSNLPSYSEIDDQNLIIMLDQMNQDIETALIHYGNDRLIKLNGKKAHQNKRSIYRGGEALRIQVFEHADSPLLHLDDELCEIILKYCGGVAYAAFCFLREPLYQLVGCHYSVSNWIVWGMVEDEFDVDPYAQAYEMNRMKAQAGWSKEELFVYINA